MASNKELNRMINNVEKAITRQMDAIKRMVSPFEGRSSDRDPDTGLSIRFMKLKARHSKLIEVSTKLQKQHLDNQLNEKKGD